MVLSLAASQSPANEFIDRLRNRNAKFLILTNNSLHAR
jgi:ribonucleotide monophosphatase NagD (HAD superfamily)